MTTPTTADQAFIAAAPRLHPKTRAGYVAHLEAALDKRMGIMRGQGVPEAMLAEVRAFFFAHPFEAIAVRTGDPNGPVLAARWSKGWRPLYERCMAARP